MAKPTYEQIAQEIKALREMCPSVRRYSTFGDDNQAAIRAQIATLERGFDVDDIDDVYSGSIADNARDAADWANGDQEESPSSGWAELVEVK